MADHNYNGRLVNMDTDVFDRFDRYEDWAGTDETTQDEINQVMRDVWADALNIGYYIGNAEGYAEGHEEGRTEGESNAYCATVEAHECEVQNVYGHDLATIDELLRFARTILNGGSVHEATTDLPAHLILGWQQAA